MPLSHERSFKIKIPSARDAIRDYFCWQSSAQYQPTALEWAHAEHGVP